MMSPVGPEQDEPPLAARAGADLRAARERLGWDLSEIAAGLRIRQPHLEALEEGRIDLLPAHAYALGFLRTYAASLGLDPEEIVRRFKAEAGRVNTRTELAFPAPMPERGIPAGAVVLLGLVLAIGAYAGWYRLSGEGRLPPESIAIPQHLQTLAQQAMPPVAKLPRTSVAAATPAQDPSPTSAEAAEPPAQVVSPTSAAAASVTPPLKQPDAAQAGASPQNPGATAAQPPPQTVLAGQLVAAQPQVPAAADSAAASTPQQPQVVLRATADSWVQVRDKSGQVLLNRILHAGDSWQVPDRPNLLLTTGNAGGTELELNGVSTGLLGAPGAVRRDLPLDPALIKQGALNPPSGNGVQQASLRTPSR
ncbi:MAG TPA: RodZ domain-containing protein [Acetobacteraceae bacterium]|nr:RodZ domain-containing protein [Acetobacteraceae bacterium]